MTCDKTTYETYKDAIGAIKALSKREKQSFHHYKCDDCGKFHLTSVKKKNLRGIKYEPSTDRKLDKPIKEQTNKMKPIASQASKSKTGRGYATFKLGELLNWKKINKDVQ